MGVCLHNRKFYGIDTWKQLDNARKSAESSTFENIIPEEADDVCGSADSFRMSSSFSEELAGDAQQKFEREHVSPHKIYSLESTNSWDTLNPFEGKSTNPLNTFDDPPGGGGRTQAWGGQ